MIEASEKKKIFAGGEASVKALVGASVVAERAADSAGSRDGVVTGNGGVAGSWKKERGENAEECGFAGAVCAEEGDGLAIAEFEGDVLERGESGAFEGLKEGAPAGARRREEFRKGMEGDGAIRHREVIARPGKRNNLGDCVLVGRGHCGKEVAR